MCNLAGYLPHGWIEAGSQLCSACGLLASLLGPEHPVKRAYLRFLTKYGRLQTRLSLELDQEFGARLVPPLFNFHVQLAFCNWLVLQMDLMERDHIEPPPTSSKALTCSSPDVGAFGLQCTCPAEPARGASSASRKTPHIGSTNGARSSAHRGTGRARGRHTPPPGPDGAEHTPRHPVHRQHPVCMERQGATSGGGNCAGRWTTPEVVRN
jgi:hypothetical protein